MLYEYIGDWCNSIIMPLSQESSSSSSSDLSADSPDTPVYSPVSNFSLSDYSSNLEEGS